jgi:hypothetical protein
MNGFSDIFMPLLTRIFNLTVSSLTFPPLWKQTDVFRAFKKGGSHSVKNYSPISTSTKLILLNMAFVNSVPLQPI